MNIRCLLLLLLLLHRRLSIITASTATTAVTNLKLLHIIYMVIDRQFLLKPALISCKSGPHILQPFVYSHLFSPHLHIFTHTHTHTHTYTHTRTLSLPLPHPRTYIDPPHLPTYTSLPNQTPKVADIISLCLNAPHPSCCSIIVRCPPKYPNGVPELVSTHGFFFIHLGLNGNSGKSKNIYSANLRLTGARENVGQAAFIGTLSSSMPAGGAVLIAC